MEKRIQSDIGEVFSCRLSANVRRNGGLFARCVKRGKYIYLVSSVDVWRYMAAGIRTEVT